MARKTLEEKQEKDVIFKMRASTLRQLIISADVKSGLVRMDNSLVVFQSTRSILGVSKE